MQSNKRKKEAGRREEEEDEENNTVLARLNLGKNFFEIKFDGGDANNEFERSTNEATSAAFSDKIGFPFDDVR